MFKYLKHSLFHVMGLLTALFLVLGGPYLVIGLAFSIATFVLGDLFLGDDKSAPKYSYPGILTLQLWLALPLLMLIVFALMWQVAPEDWFGFGWMAKQIGLVSAKGLIVSQDMSCIVATLPLT